MAGQRRAIGGEAHTAEAGRRKTQAREHQQVARAAQDSWEQRAIENNSLYPPLNNAMRSRVEAARQKQLR